MKAKTAEEIIKEKFNWTYDSDPARFQLFYDLIKPFAEEHTAQHLQAMAGENNKTLLDLEYWKKRCLLAEDCLEKSPCDPDITSEQITAWDNYHSFIRATFKESH